MQNMKYKIDEKTINKIISAAYKDAGIIDRIKIYFLIIKNPDAKKIFEEYRATAKVVKEIKPDKYPGNVKESLKLQNINPGKLIPAPAYAIIIFLITAMAVFLLTKESDEEKIYTTKEIKIAEEQVKETLAIVNKIFKKTENLIQDKVFPQRIGKPINKSLSIINDVLTGG